MSPDLDRLLQEAEPGDGRPLDVGALWAAGRRRRAWRRAGTALAGVVALLAVGTVAVGLANLQQPTVEPIAPVPTVTSTPTDEATAEPDPTETADPTEADTPTDEETDPGDAVEDEPTETVEDPAATPDPAAMQDPCADHAGREGEAFIDVVSPVDDQQLEGVVQLVGCANVFEATVLYRITDAGGDVVAEGFTTATCGTGCLGEFREDIAVDATGELTLEAYWEDASDGSERDVVTVTFTRS